MKLFSEVLSAFVFYLSFIYGESAMAQDISQQNKQLLANFANEVFVKKELTHIDQYVHTDYIQHNPLVPQGASGFQQFFAEWFKAVPDWHYQLEKVVAEGDDVWVYGVYSGTQHGDWLGIPATGKHYSIHAVDIFRIESGKLAEHWDVMDAYGLFQQLGVIQ
ncbi:ester cyclase [Methylophilus aquaticus]|uniref:Ester cyclase n=1 Tax=Methylophilus aquaticus TaxID=1971610 RepID=A0ABT9JSE6_9PROT|nr:ester cyclase [Methylophilus aquaticus]MDP8567498.1 ester cyclase [Methylophilus aquaticus]